MSISLFSRHCTALLIATLLMGFLPAVASAQTDNSLPAPPVPETASVCPIDGGVRVSLQFDDDNVSYEETFENTLMVENPSTFSFSGVSIGIGLFRDGSDIPDFWTILPNDYQMLAGESIEIPIDLSLAALPAGEYDARVVTHQGDMIEVLGSLVRAQKADDTPAYTFSKNGSAENTTTVDVALSGAGEDGVFNNLDPLDVVITTTNTADVPLVRTTMVGGITQGDTPLGMALRDAVADELLLVPGAERVTEMRDQSLEGGRYTVFTGLVSEGAFRPVHFTSIDVEGTEVGSDETNVNAAEILPYVSQVGLSSYPMTADTELVACIESVEFQRTPYRLATPMAFDLTLSHDGEELFTATESSDTRTIRDHVSFTPGVSGGDADIRLDVSTERYGFVSGTPDPEDDADDVAIEDEPTNFTLVQTISHTFSCQEPDGCATAIMNADAAEDASTVADGSSEGSGFWFYFGIVLAAALLMYIMLRRLHPEENTVPNDTHQEELN